MSLPAFLIALIAFLVLLGVVAASTTVWLVVLVLALITVAWGWGSWSVPWRRA
jgi:hypothetical protein